MSEPEFLEAADVARTLRMSENNVRVLADTGRLRVAARTLRGVRLFTSEDVEVLRAERAERARRKPPARRRRTHAAPRRRV